MWANQFNQTVLFLLKKLDLNQDGIISPAEFVQACTDVSYSTQAPGPFS